MERHRTVREAPHELPDGGLGRGVDLRRRARRDASAAGQDVHPVRDRGDLLDVVRHHDAGEPERIVELPDESREHSGGDRVLAGERLVVEDDLRIEGERAGERDAARHPPRELARPEAPGVPQPHRLELEQHHVTDRLLGEAGVLAEGERDVVEDVEVGEEGTGLEEDPHPLAERVEAGAREAVHVLAADPHAPAVRPELPADELEEGRLAHPARAEHRGDLALRHGHVEGIEDRPRPAVEGKPLDGDQRLGGCRRRGGGCLSGHEPTPRRAGRRSPRGGWRAGSRHPQGPAGSSTPSFLTGRRSVRLTPRARAETLAT